MKLCNICKNEVIEWVILPREEGSQMGYSCSNCGIRYDLEMNIVRSYIPDPNELRCNVCESKIDKVKVGMKEIKDLDLYFCYTCDSYLKNNLDRISFEEGSIPTQEEKIQYDYKDFREFLAYTIELFCRFSSVYSDYSCNNLEKLEVDLINSYKKQFLKYGYLFITLNDLEIAWGHTIFVNDIFKEIIIDIYMDPPKSSNEKVCCLIRHDNDTGKGEDIVENRNFDNFRELIGGYVIPVKLIDEYYMLMNEDGTAQGLRMNIPATAIMFDVANLYGRVLNNRIVGDVVVCSQEHYSN